MYLHYASEKNKKTLDTAIFCEKIQKLHFKKFIYTNFMSV